MHTRIRLVIALALPALAAAQGDTDLPREQMWRAPTAEEWEKPCLITWQRTWEDAIQVAQETGKPILICVNMDGEIASEHYAGVRYRQPEVVRLYEPYVCVIASVYRHSPRDFDEHGRRIPCPRFGCVTCGEHIAIEPILFEQFFDDTRVAPRHIMIELGKGEKLEEYDVYYAFDTKSVFDTIRAGIDNRQRQTNPISRGDGSIVERVASADHLDRTAVEEAYLNGDAEARRELLEAAIAQGENAPVGVLRLAVFGLDLELSRLARVALESATSEQAIDLILAALELPIEAAERERLIAALARIGETSPRARTLATVHRGLDGENTAVDVSGWSAALAGAEYPAPSEIGTLQQRLEREESAASARPQDAAAKLELAAASLAYAIDPETKKMLARDARTARTYEHLMYEDAYRSAIEAERLGAEGWRVHATIAVAASHLGRQEEAWERAAQAMEGMPPDVSDHMHVEVVDLFAQSRRAAIIRAVRAKEDWPQDWLTDTHAAYSILARHPLGTDRHAIAQYDFLRWLRARGQATRILDAALARFPESWNLHDRLRTRILAEKGVGGLETVYDEMLAADGASPNLPWFAGYAAIVAAEFHRRAGRDEAALASYARALELYDRSVASNPDSQATADHYAALALAGRARIAFEAGEHRGALDDVIAAFDRRPEAAATPDGLNVSPVDTAKMLRARLESDGETELLARLQAALDALDPAMLELPAYERPMPDQRRRGRQGGRRNR